MTHTPPQRICPDCGDPIPAGHGRCVDCYHAVRREAVRPREPQEVDQ